MNFYEQQMRKWFADSDIIRDAQFCGRIMLGKLDDELRIKLQFVSTRIADQYDAIKVTVINRTDGVVDKQILRFSDIIGMHDLGTLGLVEPFIWEYNNQAEWYTPTTHSDQAQIGDAVLDYIGMYRQENTMEVSSVEMG